MQRETIPLMLAGRDLLAQAATGTGKTAAFALPMIQQISADLEAPSADPKDPRRTAEEGPEEPRLVKKSSKRHNTAGVVLVPTRELAMQVARSHPPLRPRHGPHGRPALRRLVDAAADPRARARRRHRRRHAGPRARSHPPQDAQPRRGARAGPRRSGRDARHGVRRGHRTILEETPADAADGAVFGDDAGAHPEDCRAAPQEAAARDDRAREDRRRQAARASARSPTSSAATRSRRRSTASSTWRTRAPRSSSAARASRSTRSSRRSTRTATAPRRCTAAWSSGSATR